MPMPKRRPPAMLAGQAKGATQGSIQRRAIMAWTRGIATDQGQQIGPKEVKPARNQEEAAHGGVEAEIPTLQYVAQDGAGEDCQEDGHVFPFLLFRPMVGTAPYETKPLSGLLKILAGESLLALTPTNAKLFGPL